MSGVVIATVASIEGAVTVAEATTAAAVTVPDVVMVLP
jgi:hypothetical protein